MSEVSHVPTDPRLSWYAAREPLVVLVLAAIAIAFFFAAAGLSRMHDAQETAQGSNWFYKGTADLKAGRAEQAVNEFHAALTYSRDNYGYQLGLAQALLALNRTEEALQYLVNLWQREPENGTVNLELARIYAGKDDVTQALRYYHNAIYAIWSHDEESRRRAVRLELTDFLLKRQAHGQAESELIALVGNLPDDPGLIAHVGDLFLQVPDYERALAQYRKSLRLERGYAPALVGAAHAAFELGRYKEAVRYAKAAVAADPSSKESAQLLENAQTVIQMDPYRMGISAAKRKLVVADAFKTAGARLQACLATAPAKQPNGPDLQSLSDEWTQIQPKLSRQPSDDDVVDSAMDLVFRIEQQTSQVCGNPAGKDLALLKVGTSREGE
jgi:tetratricopeptide (TPR) repeat protein